MLINTHFIISKSVLENIESKKSFFISEKNFIYGNIKPDISSRYLLETHYLEESLTMILEKIKNLCQLTLDSLKRYFSISKLSQELGVICHFLCDFFCQPHSERWRFTHSVDIINKHVSYEKELNTYAKKMDFSNCDLDYKVHDDIDEFFHRLYNIYKSKSTSFEKDLSFSLHACREIVNHVIDCILHNTFVLHQLDNCI